FEILFRSAPNPEEPAKARARRCEHDKIETQNPAFPRRCFDSCELLRKMRGASDCLHDIARRHRVAVERSDMPPEPQHRDSIRNAEHIDQVVRNEDHSKASFAQLMDELKHHSSLLDTKRCCRFVEKYHL